MFSEDIWTITDTNADDTNAPLDADARDFGPYVPTIADDRDAVNADALTIA